MKFVWLWLFILCAHTPVLAQVDCRQLVVADFASREALPETEVPIEERQSCCGKWGPWSLPYPKFVTDPQCMTPQWLRYRAVMVAKKYIGLPYEHRHIPSMGGLDCSNFTAWVYNFAFGNKFVSHIQQQADTVGRKLEAHEKLEPGDLIYIWSPERDRISHVIMYIDAKNIIDSTGPGVAIRKFKNYKARYAWARRVIE